MQGIEDWEKAGIFFSWGSRAMLATPVRISSSSEIGPLKAP